MFKFFRKVKSYIYSIIFFKRSRPFVQMGSFHIEISEAAKNLADTIDQDILQSIYEKANHVTEKAILRSLCVPKKFGEPTAIESENNAIKLIIDYWGIVEDDRSK